MYIPCIGYTLHGINLTLKIWGSYKKHIFHLQSLLQPLPITFESMVCRLILEEKRLGRANPFVDVAHTRLGMMVEQRGVLKHQVLTLAQHLLRPERLLVQPLLLLLRPHRRRLAPVVRRLDLLTNRGRVIGL